MYSYTPITLGPILAPVSGSGSADPFGQPPADNTYRWGRVESTSPLTVRLDGDAAPLAATPDTLDNDLSPGSRVWCQLWRRRVIILGRSRPTSEAVTTRGYFAQAAPVKDLPDTPEKFTVNTDLGGITQRASSVLLVQHWFKGVSLVGGPCLIRSRIEYSTDNGASWVTTTATEAGASAAYYGYDPTGYTAGVIGAAATQRVLKLRATTYRESGGTGRVDAVGVLVQPFTQATIL